MASPNQVFAEFVEALGSRKAAAAALGCSYVYVCHVLNGVRPVTKEIAERAEQVSNGAFAKERMLWGDPDPAGDAPAKAA
jgi:succinate dehydrogenase/fumarate reductase cytochrome b subunit